MTTYSYPVALFWLLPSGCALLAWLLTLPVTIVLSGGLFLLLRAILT